MANTLYNLTVDLSNITGEPAVGVTVNVRLASPQLIQPIGSVLETLYPSAHSGETGENGEVVFALLPSSLVGDYTVTIGDFKRTVTMPENDVRLSELGEAVVPTQISATYMLNDMSDLRGDLTTAALEVIHQKLGLDAFETIQANPTDDATAALNKILLGSTVYAVSGAEASEANAKSGADNAAANNSRMSPRRTKAAIDAQAVRPQDLVDQEDTFYSNVTDHSATEFALSDAHEFIITSADGSTTYALAEGAQAIWDSIVTANAGRIYLRTLQWDHIGQLGGAGIHNAPVLEDNDTLYIKPADPLKDRVLKLTLSSGPTSVGAGSAEAKWYAFDAAELTGDSSVTMESDNDVYRVDTIDRPHVAVDPDALNLTDGFGQRFLTRLHDLASWPAAVTSAVASFISTNKSLDPLSTSYTSFRDETRDMLNGIFARLDASNLTAMFRSDVRGPWEPYTVTTDQTRLANGAVTVNDNSFQFVSTPVVDGGAVGVTWRLDEANYPEIVGHWALHRRIIFPTGVLLIVGGVNELGNRRLQANVKLISGALPAVNSTTRPTIRGVPTWSDVRDDIRATGTADDDHLVTEKAVRDALGGKPDPEDTVPFAAAFRDTYTRSFVATALNNANHGEALISSDNNVPAGAPAGTTDILAVDKLDSGGTDQTDALSEIAAGDWFRAKKGDKYIIAKIQFVKKSQNGDFEFWFNPSTAIDETLQYDEIGTGAGEIRFYSKGGGDSLPDQTGHAGQFLKTDGTNADWSELAMGNILSLEGTVTDVTEADTDLITGASNDEVYVITTLGALSTDSNNFALGTVIQRFQDFDTSYRWLPVRGAVNGQRFMVKRNGNKLQVRRAGNVATTSTIRAYKMQAPKGDPGVDGTNPAAPPTEGNHYTATQVLAATDVNKWVSVKATSAAVDISLAGSLGVVGDRIILALRTQGNYLVNIRWADGTLKIFSAEGIETLTAAGTVDLIPSGGNRAIIYTAEKTGSSEWTIREGIWQ